MLRALALGFAVVGVSAGSAQWSEVAANGTWPDPRFSHTAALTADGNFMLIFGGNNFDKMNELFAFDIARKEWRKLKPDGDVPSKRYGHQSVVTSDGRMVVFGGYNGSFLSDVHELTIDTTGGSVCGTWRSVDATGEPPVARDGHSAVLAPDGQTMLIYGGFDGKAQLDDVHALDTASFEWSQPQLLPAAAGSAADGMDDGADREAPKCSAAADAAAGAAAATTADAGESCLVPPPRYLHSAVACEGGMLVYGGYLSGGGFAQDLWQLTLAGDEGAAEVAAEEAAEEGAAPKAVPMRGSWSKVGVSGAAPGGLFGHAAAVDAAGEHMWVSGGFGGGDAVKKAKASGASSFSNALHVLDVKRRRWSVVDARPKWAPRHKHTLLATKTGQLLLFGGNDFGPTRGFYALDAAASLAALAAQAAAPTGMRALLALEVPVSLAIPRCCQCGQPPSDSQPMHPLPRRAPALSLHPCASQACALFWRGRWPSCSCSAYSSSLSRHGRVASASSTFRELPPPFSSASHV